MSAGDFYMTQRFSRSCTFAHPADWPCAICGKEWPTDGMRIAARVRDQMVESIKARIPPGSMRVAPNTDAVVWRINSDKCGEL